MKLLRDFIQLLKFGVSGITGVAVSTILFYGFRMRLPETIWVLGFYVWFYPLNLPDVAFYLATTAIGGTVHFFLSKVWVFQK